MGGGPAEASDPRSEWRETLKRREPQESNGPMLRLISAAREANSAEVPGPEAGRPTMLACSTDTPEIEVAADHSGGTVHAASDACRIANVRRAADVERRYGFVARKKL